MSTPTTLQGIPLAGLRLGAPLGSGAGGVVWAATTATGEQVAVRVLPDLDPSRQVARTGRLDLLRSLQHPGLACPLPLSDELDERLLVTRVLSGPTLATVRAGRMGLSAPEALALARDLAEPLALLHRHGVAHGDISPGNVVLTDPDDDGAARPVLIDLVTDLGWEVGTAGFVAPEVRHGQVAAPASDVWALATLCVWSARAGERSEVARVLAAALLDDPRSRPDAASIVTGLADLPATPLRVPPASVLAGAALREQAQRSVTAVRPARRARRGRHRQRSRVRRVVAGGAVAAVLAVGLIGWTVRGSSGGREPIAVANVTDQLPHQVAALAAARDEALLALDADALAAVTAAGSPARREDRALLDQLVADGTSLAGLRTEVSGAEVLAVSAEGATVRTTLQQAAHQRTTAGSTEQVAEQPARCVDVTLVLEHAQWVVESTSPCAD